MQARIIRSGDLVRLFSGSFLVFHIALERQKSYRGGSREKNAGIGILHEEDSGWFR